eukprot:4249639-Amphidinium_carterae.1
MKLNSAEQSMLEALLGTVPLAVTAVVSCLASGCPEIMAEIPKSIQATFFMRPGAMSLWRIPRLAIPSAALTARLRSSLTEPCARSVRQFSAFKNGFDCVIKYRADKPQFFTREVFGESEVIKQESWMKAASQASSTQSQVSQPLQVRTSKE